jgi:solute carrier family 35 protein
MTGYEDLNSELLGYFIIFLNNLFSVLYGQISESFGKKNNLSNIKLLIYNGYLSVPILLALILITGEYKRLMEYNQYSIGLAVNLFISCAFTLILNSSYFISNAKNSSLFTQIFSNCKVNIIY